MDDKKLQNEFDEYFEGVNLPRNMTADAKAQVKPRKRDIRKWFLRLAPVAAAFIFIVAASVAFMNKLSPFNEANGSDQPSAPSNTDKNDASTRYSYYTIDELTGKRIDPYSASNVKGLEFAKDLADAQNSNINLTAFYESGNLILAQAVISLLRNGYRHDAVLYVEYTDEYCCFEELKDYIKGESLPYRGYELICNQAYDEGESVYTVYTYADGVKYYLYVMTSEPYGYRLYFDILKKI